MNSFEKFLAESIQELPEILTWVYAFFNSGMNATVLAAYADNLDEIGGEKNQKAANVLREVSLKGWRSPKKKTGPWRGAVINDFYDSFGFGQWSDISINDNIAGSWFISDAQGQMRRHIVHPEKNSYRLSLTNGKWFAYKNETGSRVSVVSSRHVPTPESERWYPQNRISLKDYKPIPVEDVQPEVVLYAFNRIIERQVRGSW